MRVIGRRQTGRGQDDFAARNLAGAILWAIISAESYWSGHPGSDFGELLDDALARLASGLLP